MISYQQQHFLLFLYKLISYDRRYGARRIERVHLSQSGTNNLSTWVEFGFHADKVDIHSSYDIVTNFILVLGDEVVVAPSALHVVVVFALIEKIVY